MSKVFTALAVSVDGYITGPDPSPEQPLGTGGGRLFDWYGSGDTPSRLFGGFRLWPASAALFDEVADRVGATIAGRKTYDDSGGWGGGAPHPSAPLFVLSHRPAPPPLSGSPRQTFVATGIADAISAARRAAPPGRDVALMGSGVTAEALRAGLLDEVILHQVPVLLGGGTPFFRALPVGVSLTRLEVVTAPDVTHLRFAVNNANRDMLPG